MPRRFIRRPNYRLIEAIEATVKAKGLKKEYIAQTVGVSTTTLYNWQYAGQKPENTAKRLALAELLGVDVFAEGD